MGPAPGGDALTHTELKHWQENTGIELDSFEAQTLAAMSRAYLGMLQDARKHNCKWPAKRPLTRDEEIIDARRRRARRKQK